MKALRTVVIQMVSKGLADAIPVVQSDSGRSIDFIISDMTIPANAKAIFYALKPDLTIIQNNVSINDNTITINLTTQTLAVVGTVKCQIQIVSGEDSVTTFEFALAVEKSIVDNAAIESSNEFGALTDAIKQISGFYSTMSDLEAKIKAIDVGVTGVKGGVETDYRTGDVDLTLANLGYNVANNLTTTATKYLLDARQGKAINDKIMAGTTLSDGYYVYPNGLKMCWGTARTTFANTHVLTVVVTFPVQFTVVPTVNATISNTSHSMAELPFNAKCTSKTVKTVVLTLHNSSGGFDNSSGENIDWIAIGY